ncbi:hypothetical protein EKO27_g11496 [Xylaria grammica]|uniref:Uncharacterized protein n=1 Tax=Xylaria grammica TaxID=363999 RepID=A0A439CN80_9PEZI|nr:hypothetical protein EKO27_g11496 [Xylaria grammica]
MAQSQIRGPILPDETSHEYDSEFEGHTVHVRTRAVSFHRPGIEVTFFECTTHLQVCCEKFPLDKAKTSVVNRYNQEYKPGFWLNHGYQVSIHKSAPCIPPTPDLSNESNAVFAEKYVEKVNRGLKRLKNQAPSAQGQHHLANVGTQLLEQRNNAKEKGTLGIETILNAFVKDTGSLGWLANIYGRYMSFQRRQVDPVHSQTGDSYQERNVKNRERLCQLTSAVVNRLQPDWGVCASLVYNALHVTSFKGSDLYRRVSADDLDLVANSIVDRLRATEIHITVFKDIPVINPACFLAIFINRPYSEICKDIGLENLSSLNLQEEIDTLAASLGQLGLKCGQISLSTLIARSGRAVKCDDENLIIRLGPSTSVQNGQGNSHQRSPHNWLEAGNDWMQFVNLENTELPGREGSNGHLGSA